MDIEKLKALKTAVEIGSITQAAEHMGYSQPGLTGMLKRLEQEVGYPLLRRGTKMAVAVSNTIWLPPLRASLPNMRIVTNKRVTNTSMGTKESKGEGIFVGLCSILNNT